LPGAKLFHDGQFEGRRIRLPVFLRRGPGEPVDEDLRRFYRRLVRAANNPALKDGEWSLCECSGWPDNSSFRNVVAWSWRRKSERRVIVVNLAECRSQARVRLPWADLPGGNWRLSDPVQDTVYERSGDEIRESGLYVDLDPWGFHFLSIRV
jgi:hypothetical protein